MTLRQTIEALPVDIQREVQDFAEYLLHKRGARSPGPLSFSWAGILADERPAHSSVELQHKLLQSRSAQP